MSSLDAEAELKPLQRIAAGLMLLSGVTHISHFLFWAASAANTPIAAAFGVCFFLVGVVLLRRGSFGLWLGAVIPGIGAVLGGLVVLVFPEPLPIFHASLSAIVFAICLYLLG